MLKTGNRLLFSFFVLGLAVSLLFVSTVNAQTSVDVQGAPATIYVNQQVQLIANATMGTPPYSYQWYTQLWSSDPSHPTATPQGNIVPIPGANVANFNFTATSPGIYDISIRVNDSANNSVYDSFPPAGIQITVLSGQTHPSSTPKPTATTAVPECPTWIIPSLFIVATLLAIVFYRKDSQKKQLLF